MAVTWRLRTRAIIANEEQDSKMVVVENRAAFGVRVRAGDPFTQW
jgi:hypothetical protein